MTQNLITDVVVDLNDLAEGGPRKFYQVDTTADSGKVPGTGPTVVTAARLVLVGNELDRNVKQTASKIAEEIVRRTEQDLETRQASL